MQWYSRKTVYMLAPPQSVHLHYLLIDFFYLLPVGGANKWETNVAIQGIYLPQTCHRLEFGNGYQ